jgi:xanthine dehydrogenase small subunit
MGEIDAQACGATGWRGPGVAADGSRVVSADEALLAAQLDALARDATFDYAAQGQRWLAPVDAAGLARACTAHPDARLVAGATDVGLWITKQHRDLGTMISTLAARDLARVRHDATALRDRRAATLADAFEALDGDYPSCTRRGSASRRRRSACRHARRQRRQRLADRRLDAGVDRAGRRGRPAQGRRDAHAAARGLLRRPTRRPARAPGEFVAALRVPRRRDGLVLRAYKLSKRYDQDISAVFATFALALDGDRVASARIGCGGVAATPKRAIATEGALAGRAWTRETAGARGASARTRVRADRRHASQRRVSAPGPREPDAPVVARDRRRERRPDARRACAAAD